MGKAAKIVVFTIFILFWRGYALSGDCPELSLGALSHFAEMDKIEINSCVLVRGFIYQTETGRWILASEPDLKSCCISKVVQIEVEGDFSGISMGRAVTIRGRLIKNSESNRYVLNGAVLDKPFGVPYLSLVLLLAVFGIGICFRRTR